MKVQIKITDGTVIDPERNFCGPADVLLDGSKVAGMEENSSAEAEKIISAAGCLVLPGLIDFHAHLYDGGTENGVCADLACLPMGVTTAVDAGSCGADNFEGFMRAVVSSNRMRIFSLLNICPVGLATTRFHEELRLEYYDEKAMAELFGRYKNHLFGLKVRQSKDLAGNLGLSRFSAPYR
ncbi:MAG: hypothetical protein LBP78_05845 [Acidaminococcales bacterium]|jgi:predicted amidohydrolase|nr:hypothetical protein [Acidaminococcales bacterium]